MVITTDNLVKIYNTRHVVDGVSISVEQGSVVGVSSDRSVVNCATSAS